MNEEEQKNTVSESTECEKQRDEYLDGWRRAKADLINYKKEEAERLTAMLKAGNEKVIRDLIVVLDSFDLGILATQESNPAVMKGMMLIRTQLEDVLKRHGLAPIPVSKGDTFDPAKHEAIGEHESEYPEGAIVEEVEKGYMLHERVLRATRVWVSKGNNK